jgi:hypothetical protein
LEAVSSILNPQERSTPKGGGYWVAATHAEIKKTDTVDMMISTFYSIFKQNTLLKLAYD